jgi:hypothetical protein
LVCDAAIVFDEPGPLWNMKLVGFSLWRDDSGDLYVTFPSRAFGAGPERRFFELFRSADNDLANAKNTKSWILAEYRRLGEPQPPTNLPAEPASQESAA